MRDEEQGPFIAPLQTQHVAGRHGLWYTLLSLDGLTDVDLLLVDGPGIRDRSMALFLLHGLLAATADIVVDDTDRPETRRMLELWQDAFSGQLFQTADGGGEMGPVALAASSGAWRCC